MAYSAVPRRRPLGAAPPPVPTIPGLPTIRTTDDAIRFAKSQAAAFATKEMQDLVATARTEVLSKFDVKLPPGVGMAAEKAGTWAQEYISKNGIPDSPDKVAKMGRAFVSANCQELGVPPEMIAAIDLVKHMPKTAAEGAAWVEGLGKSYLKRYGIPLDGEGIAKASARAACVNFGVDPGIVDMGIEVFGDGKLDGKDAEVIAVAASSAAGAAAFSALGIPPPIGAMVGSLVGSEAVKLAKNLFGPSDLDQQKKAYAAKLAARDVRQAQCVRMGVEAWTAYNKYWDATVLKIHRIFTAPEVAPYLARAGGVRFFGVVYDPNDQFRHFCITPGSGDPIPDGCLYYCKNTWDPTKMQSLPGCESIGCEIVWKQGDPITKITADASWKACDASGSPVVVMPTSWSWADFHKTHEYTVMTLSPGGKINGELNAYALLHYWFADRWKFFPAPGAGTITTAVDAIQAAAAMADPYVKDVGAPHYDCATPGVVQELGDNVAILDRAATYVMQDIVKTMSWQAARDAAIAAKQAQEAANRAMVQARAKTAAQTITDARNTYGAGLTPAQRKVYDACVKQAPVSHYPSCREVAGGDPIMNLSTAAGQAAAARVRDKKLRRWAIYGVVGAAVVGVVLVAGRSQHGS